MLQPVDFLDDLEREEDLHVVGLGRVTIPNADFRSFSFFVDRRLRLGGDVVVDFLRSLACIQTFDSCCRANCTNDGFASKVD
jgi:hypothetical protein